MLVAVVSDTHRSDSCVKSIKTLIKDADILIHLGDNVEDAEELEREFKGEVYIVAGNCDFSRKYPKDRLIDIEGKKIFMTHGDLYAVKMGLNSIYSVSYTHLTLFVLGENVNLFKENKLIFSPLSHA